MNDFPTPPFIRPDLPAVFVLVDANGPVGGEVLFGPFPASEVVFEADNATVLYEYGSLPVRLGVTEQTGNLLRLFRAGEVRVEAVDKQQR